MRSPVDRAVTRAGTVTVRGLFSTSAARPAYDPPTRRPGIDPPLPATPFLGTRRTLPGLAATCRKTNRPLCWYPPARQTSSRVTYRRPTCRSNSSAGLASARSLSSLLLVRADLYSDGARSSVSSPHRPGIRPPPDVERDVALRREDLAAVSRIGIMGSGGGTVTQASYIRKGRLHLTPSLSTRARCFEPRSPRGPATCRPGLHRGGRPGRP